MFADPSRSTFRALQLITGIQGFRLTPSNQQRKSYMTRVTNNTLLYGLRNLFVRHHASSQADGLEMRSAHE